MSHFVVLVIGDDIDTQLAPFNEQPEQDDPHVKLEFHDETDEYRKEYEEESAGVYHLPNGKWKYPWHMDDEDKKLGAKLVATPYKELYGSFEDFCRDYHGAEPNEDGRYGYRSNPKAKWDWYQIGGRWTGYFKAKPGVVGVTGESGLMTPEARPGYYDQLTRANIDFEAMREEAAKEASERFDRVEAAVGDLEPPKPWDEFRKDFESIDDARKAFHAHPYMAALREANLVPIFQDPVALFSVGREVYVERARNSSFVPYAILKDGEWYQKGEMGWFGMSTDEMTQEEWNQKVWELLRDLPGDTLITAVDCHI